MEKIYRQAGRTLCIAVMLAVFTAGCASHMTTIVSRPPAHAQKLGRVEGRASGSLFQAVIPILLNSRTERAYANALAKAPGATALMDVTLREDWLWYYLGTISTVTISGEAVK